MRIFFSIGCFLFCIASSSYSQDIQKLKTEVRHRIDTYLDKDKKLGDFYSLSDEGMIVYASVDKKLKKTAEFKICWADIDLFRNYLKKGNTSEACRLASTFAKDQSFSGVPDKAYGKEINRERQPLEGLRIALDPGHTAGDMASAKIEQKYIEIPADSLKHTSKVELVEGSQTLCTALFLKKQLEDAGAIVFMTHDKPNGTAFGKTFEEWLKTDLDHTLDSLVACKKIAKEKKIFYKTKATKRTLFLDIFKDIELKKRSEIINAFQPTITVIIHYNVDEKNTDWKKLSDKNFTMAFIGGAFLPSSLNKPENRFDFLRMAITDDLDKSEKLSAGVVKSFSKNLNIPIANKNDATYLKENCLSTPSQGVFCRNLLLTRLICGPLVYGETLYQDNKQEAALLIKQDTEVNGIKTSSRIKQVADAYYQGILEYFK